ncbi:MAG TPA: hypothetical protein VFW98_17680 [Gemmatimonadaceae bacterium]|nr:hypothetical protein [Gemmatimonadaceae bacterium]
MVKATPNEWPHLASILFSGAGIVLIVVFNLLAQSMRRERRQPSKHGPRYNSLGGTLSLRELFDASLYTPRGNRLRRIGLALMALSFALSALFWWLGASGS